MTNIIKSSGNIFEDIGIENPETHKLKADIAILITQIIKKRKLTQKGAAQVIKATQADISKLRNGNLSGFTLDRLLNFLIALNRDIKITIKPVPRSKNRRIGSIAVAA